jgi:hypothetical protein
MSKCIVIPVSEHELCDTDLVFTPEMLVRDPGWEQTPGICLEAVQRDSSLLQFVKRPSVAIALAAIKMNPSCWQFLSAAQLEKLDVEARALYNMTMIEVAIETNWKVLELVVEQTFAIQKLAISCDAKAIKYCKPQTLELCQLAFSRNTNVFPFLHFQTPEMCLKAVREHYGWLEYVMEKTDDICKAALEEDGLALAFCDQKSFDLCKLAVDENGAALQFVPEDIQKRTELEAAAVYSNAIALKWCLHQTENMCFAAVNKVPMLLEYVKKQKSYICLAAVQHYWEALQFVKKQNIEMIRSALKQSPAAVKYIHYSVVDAYITKLNTIKLSQQERAILSILCQGGEPLRSKAQRIYAMLSEESKKEDEK